MFRVLVLDDREGIRLGLKHLLCRYELVFGMVEDAIQLLNEDRVDLILLNLPHEDGSSSNWKLLKEWGKRKKIIVVADRVAPELSVEAKRLGALTCIDKLDIPKLPLLVEKYLNQAETRIISLATDEHGYNG